MKILFLFCTILLLTSCIKEVKLDVDPLPQKVVVNGFICPDSTFKVHISLTSAMQESKQLVLNATVLVFENDVFLYSLVNQGTGWYGVWASPSEGKKYRIEVSVPNFETVTAETEIPIFPEIQDAWYEKIGANPNEFGTYEAKTTIIFQDDPTRKNYYQPGRNIYLYEQTKETDESILTETDLEYNPYYYYFSDALFDGQVKQLVLRGGGIIQESFSEIYYQQDYTHSFRIVSEEYFKGIKTWTLHSFNQSSDGYINDPLTLLFLGEPIEMYSNVTGGLGVFAGYNSKNIPIPPHE